MPQKRSGRARDDTHARLATTAALLRAFWCGNKAFWWIFIGILLPGGQPHSAAAPGWLDFGSRWAAYDLAK